MERPSLLPRETRKAAEGHAAGSPGLYSSKRGALLAMFAHRMAALRQLGLRADKEAVLLAAVRDERRAAMAALKRQEQVRRVVEKGNRKRLRCAGPAEPAHPIRPKLRKMRAAKVLNS